MSQPLRSVTRAAAEGNAARCHAPLSGASGAHADSHVIGETAPPTSTSRNVPERPPATPQQDGMQASTKGHKASCLLTVRTRVVADAHIDVAVDVA